MLGALVGAGLSRALTVAGDKALGAGADAVAKRAREALRAQPLGAAEEAVRRAVEAARRELIDDYWAGEDALSRDLVALLEHPPFAEEVARRLLFRGQPDFERLREHYLGQAGEGDAAASERWQALQVPLADFIDLIERHLEADPHFGGLVRDGRRLATIHRGEDEHRMLTEVSREIQAAQRELAERSGEGVGLLAALIESAGRREAHLGEIVDLLRQVAEGVGAGGEAPAAPGLLPAEAAYLQELRAKCDDLPLAEESRDVTVKVRRRASLANVYVDLEVQARPDTARVLVRLGVPEEDRAQLLARLQREAEPVAGGRNRLAGDGSAEAEPIGEEAVLLDPEGRGRLPLDLDRLAEDHPLRRYAPDKEALQAALRPLTALEALANRHHLVLLGDPGSGKSTFVNHLAHSLAGAVLGVQELPAAFQGLFDEPPFPLRLVLRRWSAGLPRDARGGRELVYRALEEGAPGLSRERLLARLAGPGVLVLFDGLDEVPAGPEGASPGRSPAGDRRRIVIDAVAAFCEAHPGCRVLVTSRVKPYREGTDQVPGLPAVELAELDGGRIRTFAQLWYDELARIGSRLAGGAAECRRRLLAALGGRPTLAEMAKTPLLLTMLAKVNARDELPDGRAELYRQCVEQLLWEWEKRISGEGGVDSLHTLLEDGDVRLQRADVERVLWQLAFEVHGTRGRETADLPADSLQKALARVHPTPHRREAWASRVVALMEERGGLLASPEPGVFTFPHTSFQEYLAARWLAEQPDRARLARERAEVDAWGEVVLLACGHLGIVGRYGDVQAIVHELVEGSFPRGAAGWRRLLVAGQAWREFGPHRAEGKTGTALARRLPNLLTRLMQHRRPAPPLRLEAGLTLAGLGVLPRDLDGWVEIPADRLDYAFKMGKYPVTNAQYQRFVQAGGYDEEAPWWTEEARREILDFEELVGEGAWPRAPRYAHSPRFNPATLPVVGVSWYEAQAYAGWLTRELRAGGEIGDDLEVRLPTVAERQRAASGPEGTNYPWGEEPETWRANTKESELGGPSPVHMYPGGKSPEEVLDLAGNVWEWTADRHEADRRARTLLGGAWWTPIEKAGAAARVRDRPLDWYHIYGFRVVVVPVSRA